MNVTMKCIKSFLTYHQYWRHIISHENHFAINFTKMKPPFVSSKIIKSTRKRSIIIVWNTPQSTLFHPQILRSPRSSRDHPVGRKQTSLRPVSTRTSTSILTQKMRSRFIETFLPSNDQKTSIACVDVTAPPPDGNGHAWTVHDEKRGEKGRLCVLAK